MYGYALDQEKASQNSLQTLFFSQSGSVVGEAI
jgi:hypothetical protein